jgi:hypothetical protein
MLSIYLPGRNIVHNIPCYNKVRELATVCLPWQQWTETSVLFDYVYYIEVLKWLHEKVRRKRPEFFANILWIFHHYNAPAHTALSAREFLASKEITVLEHSIAPQ